MNIVRQAPTTRGLRKMCTFAEVSGMRRESLFLSGACILTWHEWESRSLPLPDYESSECGQT